MDSTAPRIIARLDVKGPNLVKGIHLEGLRVLGNPADFARHYYQSGADEIFFMDVVASLYNRNSLHDIIKQTVAEVFVPLTVGGGLRSIEDIRTVLRAGADKVCLNTAAVKSPDLIREASLKYGSSTIVVAIEAIKQPDGSYAAFVDNGREVTGKDVVSWAKQVVALGAGEVVITSVDRDGTGEGMDHELIKLVTSAVNVPVVAHGGANSVLDVASAISASGASGVAIASMTHYAFVEDSRDKVQSFGPEGNTTFLKSGKSFGRIKPLGFSQLKIGLRQAGIPCRPYVGSI